MADNARNLADDQLRGIATTGGRVEQLVATQVLTLQSPLFPLAAPRTLRHMSDSTWADASVS